MYEKDVTGAELGAIGQLDVKQSFLMGCAGFFLKDVLGPAMKGPIINATEGNEIIFTISAATKEEVDSWATEVEQAGGTVVSKPEEFGKGYYGFVFADPDGHRFNVFYM